jgi:hypothetical protein
MPRKTKRKSFFEMTSAERDTDVAKYDSGVPLEAMKPLSRTEAGAWERMKRADRRRSETYARVQRKVAETFGQLRGADMRSIDPTKSANVDKLAKALARTYGKRTRDVAFHLLDWSSDAAFLVAWMLYPNRFNREEVKAGVTAFLVHAPNHIAAAAKLSGWPSEDVFKVGALTPDGRKSDRAVTSPASPPNRAASASRGQT